jgi:hypothetical protein
MAETQTKYQIIKIAVASASSTNKIEADVEPDYNRVVGVFANVSDTNARGKGTLKNFTIDGNEYFPEDFEIGLICPTTGIPMKDVIVPVKEKGEKAKIKGEYIDNNAAGTSFPYYVRIYLKCEKDVI